MSTIVSIHQPNFAPWIGYFYKIIKSDIFVFVDQVQYVKNGFCNRNYIKMSNGNKLLITIPVKKSKGAHQAFNEIEIDYSVNWQDKIFKTLQTNYGKTKYFKEYFPLFSDILKIKYPNLAYLNINLIKSICNVLRISTKIYVASEIPFNLGNKNEMIISIVKYFKGEIYLSGQGAKKYNDENLYSLNNIKLEYSNFIHPIYPQSAGDFVSNLSILDLLFNCGFKSYDYING